MLAQRVGLTALRRAAVKPNTVIPRVLAVSLLQQRSSTSLNLNRTTAAAAAETLASARLIRPVAPHLTVYKMDQTWFGASAWQRITGASLACGLYGFSFLYLLSPVVGFHIESSAITAFVATLPAILKGGIKFWIAWPFTFHAFNGVRHLVMDMGMGFTKSAIFAGGWGVWGLSVLASVGLVAFY